MVVEGIIDTSIVIDYLRRYLPAKAWLDAEARHRFAITPVVWMETLQGASNKIELSRAVELLGQFAIEHTTPEDDRWAMRQMAAYHLSHGIEFQDVMIASIAARLRVPVYTINLKHYSVLPDVIVQRPY